MGDEKLPKIGQRIPVERFFVSKLNVRFGEPFGNSEQDKTLIEQLRHCRIVEAFKARPEGPWPEGRGYGVYVGRRRFLAKKAIGAKAFVVGQDCIIENISEEEAREQSLIENIDLLRQPMSPITRARRLSELVSFSTIGLRAVARRLGLPASTLSEWLKILDLAPEMQEQLGKGNLQFTEGLQLAKLKLGSEKQKDLAELLDSQGRDAFLNEVQRFTSGKLKKGVPKGKYLILRTIFARQDSSDMDCYERVKRLADAKNMKAEEYCKWVITEHVKNVSRVLDE